MKKLSVAILLCAALTNGYSQSASKTENIKLLLELTGSGKLGVQVAQSMIGSFKTSYPNVTDEFWNNFLKEINSDTLVSMIIPIYDKYYSDDEIKQLIAFYQTPIGKKVISTLPQIMQESMQAGQTWGREIGQKVYEDLKEKGFIKKEE